MATQNQTVRLTGSANPEATLVISLHKGKKDFSIKIRQKAPGEKDINGKPEYFDGDDKGGKAAETRLAARVEEAKKQGWVVKETAARGPRGFTEIPPPPAKKAAAATDTAKPDPKKK